VHFLPGLKSAESMTTLGHPDATNEQIVGAVIDLLERAVAASAARLASR
jgi:hypothetical protein